MEPTRRGRPRKVRPGILSAEQAAALLTPDQVATAEADARRERDAERKRQQRAREKIQRDRVKAASLAETERKWWESNRAALSAEASAAMQAQDYYIRDLLFSMETVVNVQELDPELIDIVVAFVKDRGVTHLGYISKNELPDWPSRQYWRDAELMDKLIAENSQTEQYVKYGLLAALPDWRVVDFLKGKAGWTWQRAADLVGYHTDHLNDVSYR
jgi:hypothetical protein